MLTAPLVTPLEVSEPSDGPRSVYMNNAATTWPKPERVYDAVNGALRATGSLGRTARRSSEAESPLERARARCAAFLGVRDPQRLAITPGCTWASNIAIQSMPWKSGDRIVHSGLEHNSASRPCGLVAERHGVEVLTAPYRPGDPMDLDFVEDLLAHGRVRLVVATMASNVTGELLPWRELRRLTRAHGALLMLDAAQTAGVVPIDIGELEPDLMVFAGHKGLYGPPGVGLLYVSAALEQRFFAVGGTGHDSGKLEMSARMPAMFEVGTFNGPAIAGLEAGIAFVAETGPENILRHERALTARFLEGLASREGVQLYGHPDPERRLSVVSCRFKGREPKAVAAWLAEQGVVTRAGYHCSPLAHRTIGSHPFGGTVRFSFGLGNTLSDVERVLALLAELPADVGRAEATQPTPPDQGELDFEI